METMLLSRSFAVVCWCVGFAIVVDKVAVNGELYAIRVILLRTIIGADANVGRFLSFW